MGKHCVGVFLAVGFLALLAVELPGRLSSYINKTCFVPYPTIASGGTTGFGNSGAGLLVGPNENNFNASLVKRFSIKTWTEASNLEFGAEAVDVFKHPQFSNPSTSQASSAFGTITSLAVYPRVMQTRAEI